MAYTVGRYIGAYDTHTTNEVHPAGIGDWCIYTVTYFLLSASLIPISLYVTWDIIKGMLRHFMVSDLHMYDEEQDEPCQVRTMSLIEELGQAPLPLPAPPHASSMLVMLQRC